MISYIFKLSGNNLSFSSDYIKKKSVGDCDFFYDNLLDVEVDRFIAEYNSNSLNTYLDDISLDRFLFFVHDRGAGKFLAYNDHMGTNEILYAIDGDVKIVSDTVKEIYRNSGVEFSINNDSVYELLSFGSVLPPRTFYNNVSSVSSASCLEIDLNSLKTSVSKYWDLPSLFQDKIDSYDELVSKSKKAMFESMNGQEFGSSLMALSGGIDSGGILGMISHHTGKVIDSVTVGPYGKKSGDLKSSRKVVERSGTKNHEIYPEVSDVEKLKHFTKNMNHPVDGHFTMSNSLIFDFANNHNYKSVVYGFGTNLMLGSQKMDRLAFYLDRIEKYIPFALLRVLYSVAARLKNISVNQRNILLNKSWSIRFFYSKAALFWRESAYYKNISENFESNILKAIDKSFANSEKLDIVDRIVLLELEFWCGYQHMGGLCSLGKNRGLSFFTPITTPYFAREIFKAKNSHRSERKWDKAVIRDMFKDYISERLYNNKPKALMCRYNEWFKESYEDCIDYLETSKIVKSVIDLKYYRKNFWSLPEPGFSLIRLLNLAVWYDVNWNKENVGNFSKIFKK